MKIQIINSKGHYDAGWFSKPERVQFIKNGVLNHPGFEVDTKEVSSVASLEILLNGLSPDTLVWANAYYVDTEEQSVAWLNEFIEKRELPLLGSNARVLENLYRKDICQTILDQHNIPVPSFGLLLSKDIDKIESFFNECKIGYPLVLKPTSECSSFGVCLVKNQIEAVEKGRQILIDFPNSNLLVEEFLPNNDITCGYLELGEDIILMPTHYSYNGIPGKDHIYPSKDRLAAINKNRNYIVITEQPILEQLEVMMPKIVEVLNIRDITRVDGRMDEKGVLRYFDINGLPGLGFDKGISNTVELCFLFYQDYPQETVYKALINTIVASALTRNSLPVPKVQRDHNLFKLESDLVIRTKKRGLPVHQN